MAKVFEAKNIRNVVVLGHQSSGKTTFAEGLAFVSGSIPQKGEVEKKNTISDYTAEEQRRGSSTQLAVVPMVYGENKINILDVPGNDDFIGEVIGVTRIVKGAVLLIDASVGVQVGTVKHWNQIRRRNIPSFIFVNKMDKENINFDELLAEIKEKLGKEAIPFTYPLGHDSSFDGFANVIEMKAYKFVGKDRQEVDVHEDKKAKLEELHNVIVEAVAGTDDALLEKYFGGEEFTEEEVATALRKGVMAGELIPIIVGSATKNIGLKTLLDMFVSYLPSPADLGTFEAVDDNGKAVERKTADSEPFSAYVFKTVVDPYSGVINIIKVNSGVLHSGDDVYVGNGTQRVSMLYSMSGKKLDSITEVHAGDIAAVTRLEGVASGMTLSSPKAIAIYKSAHYPTAVIFKAIEIKNKNDESKLGPALQKIQLEDPCVEVKRNNETKQLLLGGVSNSHIDFVLGKLKDVYKIEVNTFPMKVVYRESIKKTAEGDGRYVKQSGGSGFYGVVKMRFEPTSGESEFAEEVFGGAVPKNYFPAVEKGFFEALNSGLLAGFPVIGVKGVLVDGKYHPVDSNEQAFKMAGILAFKDAYMKCNPIILEPIMRIHVVAPSQYTGDVMSDLNTRRARIQNMEEHEGNQDIEALVPEAEIIDYATQLKSITQASGYFVREFEGYEEVPEYLKDKVIKENKIGE